MTTDVQLLMMWIFFCVVIAAIGTTAVPIIYAFLPWRTRPIGKLFMTRSIAFAVTIDLTLLFFVWPTANILVMFWVNAIGFTFIAASNLAMAVWLLKSMYHYKKQKRGMQDAARQQDVQHDEVPCSDRTSGDGDPLLRGGDDLGSPEGA